MRFPSLFPSRGRLILYAALLSIFVAVKIPLTKKFELREISGPAFKEDVLARRAYLVDRVTGRNLSISDMPLQIGKRFKGEWLLGTYSMFVSALTNIAFLYPETRAEALPLVERSILRLFEEGTREFDTEGWNEDPLQKIEEKRGHIGYYGHVAWVLGAYKLLGGDARFDGVYRAIVSSLRASIREGKHNCAQTYPNETYVMDNVVALAALKNFDRIFGIESDPEVSAWLVSARDHLIDPKTGLLLFSLDTDGSPLLGSRGSGAGWNSFFLPFVDKRIANDQFELLKRGYDERIFWLFRGIREYPRGVFGVGDVDSGPVLFGLSPSGTGFSIAGARRTGDAELFADLLFTAEAAGTTVSFEGKRRYLFAPLVGDAIILAMKTATEWDGRFLNPPQ